MVNYETLDAHNEKTEENSFEENLKELENIVFKLENGEVPLDEAINEFHRAMILVKTCDDKLNDAKDTLAKLVKDNDDIIDFNIDE